MRVRVPVYQDTNKDGSDLILQVAKPDYEHGEMLMYKNLLLEEMGDVQKTYDHLLSAEPFVLDKLSVCTRSCVEAPLCPFLPHVFYNLSVHSCVASF